MVFRIKGKREIEDDPDGSREEAGGFLQLSFHCPDPRSVAFCVRKGQTMRETNQSLLTGITVT
jgi:hypothetical protein